MKRTVIATIVSIALLLASVAAVAAWSFGRSSLTEDGIRTGELNCLILTSAFGHGWTRADIPATYDACRIYLFTLRKP